MQHEGVRKSATREIPRASEAAHAPACRRIPTRTGWGTPSARTWPAAPWRPKRLRTPAPAPDSMPPARLKGDLFPQSASAEKRTSAALTEMPIGLDSRTGMWAIRRGIARSAPPKQKQNSGRREPPSSLAEAPPSIDRTSRSSRGVRSRVFDVAPSRPYRDARRFTGARFRVGRGRRSSVDRALIPRRNVGCEDVLAHQAGEEHRPGAQVLRAEHAGDAHAEAEARGASPYQTRVVTPHPRRIVRRNPKLPFRNPRTDHRPIKPPRR